MPNIKITVAEKIATNTTPGEVIVCGNSDYTVTFDLDAEWDAEPKKVARFSYIRDGRTHYKDQPFEGNTVAVPKLANVRQVTVGVYAGTPDDPGDLHTTTAAAIWCKPSILCGDAVEEITPEEKAGLQQQITAHDDRLAALEEGGTGTGGKPGDWSQNDPTAPDYIKHRTHYEEVLEVEASIKVSTGGNYTETVLDKIYEQRATAKYLRNGTKFFYTCDTAGKNYQISDGQTTYEFRRSGTQLKVINIATGGYPDITVTYLEEETEVHTLDPKYLPPEVAARKPLLLDADSAETYQNDPAHGDEALEAIKSGRKILVRVPNADGGSFTAIYSPVLMYQVPNYQNKYLYLFFLRDEKQDLSALVGLPAGSVQMPTYGQLKLLLSQEYNSNPLES